VNLISPITPLNATDIQSLNISCTPNPSPVNSITACSFPLSTNKTLPTDFRIIIGSSGVIDAGGTTAAQACTLTSGNVTCTNVPTGSVAGGQSIFGNLGSGNTAIKTNTGKTVVISVGVNLGNVSWVFTPTQGSASPLFRSPDNTNVSVKNLVTDSVASPADGQFTCKIEARALQPVENTAAWTLLADNVAYTAANGCGSDFTKAIRANGLNWSIRITVTSVADTTKVYTFYNVYTFRFQGAGTAVGN
jgi:hypothetical protein